jgi:hypothetical protein
VARILRRCSLGELGSLIETTSSQEETQEVDRDRHVLAVQGAAEEGVCLCLAELPAGNRLAGKESGMLSC